MGIATLLMLGARIADSSRSCRLIVQRMKPTITQYVFGGGSTLHMILAPGAVIRQGAADDLEENKHLVNRST